MTIIRFSYVLGKLGVSTFFVTYSLKDQPQSHTCNSFDSCGRSSNPNDLFNLLTQKEFTLFELLFAIENPFRSLSIFTLSCIEYLPLAVLIVVGSYHQSPSSTQSISFLTEITFPSSSLSSLKIHLDGSLTSFAATCHI